MEIIKQAIKLRNLGCEVLINWKVPKVHIKWQVFIIAQFLTKMWTIQNCVFTTVFPRKRPAIFCSSYVVWTGPLNQLPWKKMMPEGHIFAIHRVIISTYYLVWLITLFKKIKRVFSNTMKVKLLNYVFNCTSQPKNVFTPIQDVND